MTASRSRGTARRARPAIVATSCTNPVGRARIVESVGTVTGVVAIVFIGLLLRDRVGRGLVDRALAGRRRRERLPVISRNTSSSVGVRSVRSRTTTPAFERATATGPIVAAPCEVASTSSPSLRSTTSMSSSVASAASASFGRPSMRTITRSDPTRRFRSAGDPSTTSRPSSMIPTRWASESASSRYCVVSRIVMPSCSLRARTSSQTRARLTGSSPVVGSSRKRTSGLCTSAAARSRRRRMPPEYVPIGRRIASPRSIMSVRSRTRSSTSVDVSP